MKNYSIYVHGSEEPFNFIGKYRRDLEKPNWHYYETEKGKIVHFRKTQMQVVFEDEIKETDNA